MVKMNLALPSRPEPPACPQFLTSRDRIGPFMLALKYFGGKSTTAMTIAVAGHRSPFPQTINSLPSSYDFPASVTASFTCIWFPMPPGETLNTVARAATAHYSDYQPVEHIYALGPHA